jgi:hypothetical protein
MHLGVVSRAGPVVVVLVGVSVTAAGALMLIYRDRMLRALARSPGVREESWVNRLLAQVNGLVVPIVMVPLGVVIIAVGIARLG